MGKICKTVLFFIILSLLIVPITVYGETYEDLDSLDITLSKEVVHPDTEVTVNINFGQLLGSYDINIDFDDALFDYVGASKGAGSVSRRYCFSFFF